MLHHILWSVTLDSIGFPMFQIIPYIWWCLLGDCSSFKLVHTSLYIVVSLIWSPYLRTFLSSISRTSLLPFLITYRRLNFHWGPHTEHKRANVCYLVQQRVPWATIWLTVMIQYRATPWTQFWPFQTIIFLGLWLTCGSSASPWPSTPWLYHVYLICISFGTYI